MSTRYTLPFAFLARLTGRTSEPEDSSSRTPPTVDGQTTHWDLGDGIGLQITAHTAVHTPCWTAVTTGLPGQQLALTVRRDRDATLDELPPLLHALVPKLAEQPAHPGLLTAWSPEGPGILGCGRFYGWLYAAPMALEGVDGTDEALMLLPLDEDECAMLYVMGPLRMMARLGEQERFFPTTPFADPQRPSLVPDPPGVLAQLPTLFASRFSATRLDDDQLHLVADPTQLEALADVVDDGMFRILGLAAGGAHATLVYHPDQPLGAITGRTTARALALNGLVVVRADTPEAGLTEDLALLRLPADTYATFVDALLSGTPTTLAFDGTITALHLRPFTGQTLFHPEHRPESTSPTIHLLTPESELARAVSTDDLAPAIQSAIDRLTTYCEKNPQKQSGLGLGIQWSPEGSMYTMTSRSGPPEDQAWCDGLLAAVDDLPGPPTTGLVQVVLEIPT